MASKSIVKRNEKVISDREIFWTGVLLVLVGGIWFLRDYVLAAGAENIQECIDSRSLAPLNFDGIIAVAGSLVLGYIGYSIVKHLCSTAQAIAGIWIPFLLWIIWMLFVSSQFQS
jgi:hypothetical protein